MNPFTRYLSQRLKNRELKAFQRDWGQAEALIVTTYRGESAPADQQTWEQLRRELIQNYPKWEQALQPYWQASSIAGQEVHTDPFRSLLEHESLENFRDNWPAMQTLPAAREALNRLILANTQEA